ncbi:MULTISPECIES: bifunctional diaminohydroxyphosphoribosylaminopyrimidine deaminase/5-amino-6-(5-phosphoribosylamino)uracil reductase RibD [Winogradskyella]|uniref:bifunctional diaminohydroxyphosphoribosylaminopyrimidine deaminase/5-amino-6-(5-phosphoribosylamino)uracil reductase RibD n=1 Tax=Winogradskyella TaxID=286104 RepID=UPI0015CD928F|nr:MULTISPECIES: bifunctional diaminohydroxyphosphoribosylaminopyrimidine deaminase/5-amino-6-(5-phosphoribosylamino)uracil reductase RibD [Winogradskyella]QXP78359.1 bifunctional diaminohydroxyphosphoribosylaminopyrimidine deaminase/5-amino-6-(5-phosphoribosylamino)uracil reductase RibD [Winogradskyella sp. HaHa_3_26]
MTTHETYINRCLQIAKNGLGSTRPNPMVGAVIVYNNTIISEGFTCEYGGNHAEVNAINAVKDKSLLAKSTIYVTLEPCSHFGKTPPCSDLIVSHKIPNVVIGCIDDNPEVAGKGIAKLKASGCNVTVGVLETECKEHHKRFFTFHNKKRPYIILKWAETKDGFIAPKTRDEQKPVWITNPYSRQLVHKWRAEEQAILVGTNTVLEDNPSLTVRDWTGKNPIRVVLDKDLKLNTDASIFNDEAETIVINSEKNKSQSKKIEFINWDLKDAIAKQICDVLHHKNINSIIIEGGAKTLQTFIDEELWDEARIFVGHSQFNEGTKAPELKGQLISETDILEDKLKTIRPNRF